MKGRTYSMVGESANVPYCPLVTPSGVITARITVNEGGYVKDDKVCVVNMKYTALKTAANSPSLLSDMPKALTEASLSCVDITSGVTSAIGDNIPCAVAKDGKLWVQSITTDHIYAITGSYIMA